MSSLTPNLQLTKPDRGEPAWGVSMNANADLVDSAVGSLNATVDDLPMIYRYADTFNGPTGSVIALPREVDAVNEYSVHIAPTSRAGSIGDIYVTKAVDQVTVHCSSANTSDTFEITIYYTGDVSSYGGSIYRRYYVSPAASITDHSNAATVGSIAYVAALIGSAPATLILPANHTYTIDSDIDLSANPSLRIVFDPGAILARTTGDEIFTLHSPDNLDARRNQKVTDADMLAFANSGTVYAEWWGAQGDGSTDDTTAIGYALSAAESVDGGVLQLLAKNYVANLTLSSAGSNVTIRGLAPADWFAALGDYGLTRITAAATGAVIDTPAASTLNNVTIENLYLCGLGAGTAAIGIRLRRVHGSMVRDCSFENFADQGIFLDDYCMANHFMRLKGVNCLSNNTRTENNGVFQVGKPTSTLISDNYFTNCEMTASLSAVSDANLYVNAWAVYGSVNFFQGCIGEISDIGFWVAGDWNKFSICRADLNLGYGFYLTTGATQNQFLSSHALRNSQDTDNTYDGFHCENNGSNFFIGCNSDSLPSDAAQQRYGFYDDVSSNSSYNLYFGCNGSENNTGLFRNNAYLGSGFMPSRLGTYDFTDGDTTPAVAGKTICRLGYSTDVTITDFDDGAEGQVIRLIKTYGAGTVTIANNANIVTNTGSNKAMVSNRVYTFVHVLGVWYEND